MDQPIRVFVSVGTDHHSHDRLIKWVDEWLERRPDDARSFLVQHGHTRPSVRAQNVRFLERDDLVDCMTRADVVVTHGGPGSIFDARSTGKVPVVLPRDPQYGEAVDGHQLRFARYAAEAGLIVAAFTPVDLDAAVERALANPGALVTPVGGGAPESSVRSLETVVAEAVARGGGAR